MAAFFYQVQPNQDQVRCFLMGKQAWERAINNYQGSDPIDHWYEYLCWYENHVTTDIENKFRETLERCLAIFEQAESLYRDVRFVRLWLKYIALQPNPLHFFETLFQRGTGRQTSEFYIHWANCYEAMRSFAQCDSIYNLAYQEKAEPIAELQEAQQKYQQRRSMDALLQQQSPTAPTGLQQVQQVQQVQVYYRYPQAQQQTDGSPQVLGPPEIIVQPIGPQIAGQPFQSTIVVRDIQEEQIPFQGEAQQQFQAQQQYLVQQQQQYQAQPEQMYQAQHQQMYQNPQQPVQYQEGMLNTQFTQQEQLPYQQVASQPQQEQSRNVNAIQELPGSFVSYSQNNYQAQPMPQQYQEPMVSTQFVQPHQQISTQHQQEQSGNPNAVQQIPGIQLQNNFISYTQSSHQMQPPNNQYQGAMPSNEFSQETLPPFHQNTTQQQHNIDSFTHNKHNTHNASQYQESTLSSKLAQQEQLTYQQSSNIPDTHNINRKQPHPQTQQHQNQEEIISNRNQLPYQQEAPQQHQEQSINVVQGLSIQLPNNFASYARNSDEDWKPALTIEEPKDPNRVCHYLKNLVYPAGANIEYSPEELLACKFLYPLIPSKQEEKSLGLGDICIAQAESTGIENQFKNSEETLEGKEQEKKLNKNNRKKYHPYKLSTSTGQNSSLSQPIRRNTRTRNLSSNDNKSPFDGEVAEKTCVTGLLPETLPNVPSAPKRIQTQSPPPTTSPGQHRHLSKALKTIEKCMAQDFIDPFDIQLCKAFLTKMKFPRDDITRINYKVIDTLLPKIPNTRLINIPDAGKFNIEKEIGKGAFATIYKATDLDDGKSVALKYEKPTNLWEVYICDQVLQRIKSPHLLDGLFGILSAVIATNGSLIVTELAPFGTLLNVNNKIRQATGKCMHETLIMYFSAQICQIVHYLHMSKIIHADIKPDNFLVMRLPSTDFNVPCLRLIDFGRSIDMQLFPNPDTIKFRKVIETDSFTCIEMKEGRPWSYETDIFCVAGTLYVLLFGEYMKVQKNRNGVWDITQKLPRYLNKTVWTEFFSCIFAMKANQLPNLLEMHKTFSDQTKIMNTELLKQVRNLCNVLLDR